MDLTVCWLECAVARFGLITPQLTTNRTWFSPNSSRKKVLLPDYSSLRTLTSLSLPESFLLECPITGGLEALKKGQMAVWVGGSKEAYQEVKPILDASYSSVMYTGGLGSAMIPKVLSNMLCGLQVCAMAEAMMIGKSRVAKCGVSPPLKQYGFSKYNFIFKPREAALT